MRAAGVNAVDWKIRAGHLQDAMPVTLPAGSGRDAEGVVDQVGERVDGVAVGDPVFGSGSDTYAEHAVLSAWARLPDGLLYEEAVGCPVPVETVLRVLRQVGVRAGDTLLVSGASAGVGSAVLQIARGRASRWSRRQARTTRTTCVRWATATTYGDGLVGRVRRLAPAGVDAALDLAGSGVIPELVEITRDPQKVLSIADFTAPAHGAQVSGEPEDPPAALAEAVRLFSAGQLRIPVEETFPLERADHARTRSAAGHARGRLVLTVR